MRSTYAPTISAGVIIANVIWKAKNNISGSVPLKDSVLIPERKAFPSPPQ